ncbi:MAG: trehalase family glycosidase [Bacteroidota bacterium]
MKTLLSTAEQVLQANWRGGFTVPSSQLYPFQWNWDSGFISLGHAYFNVQFAIQELESLFSGQWDNGLLPHIIFHSEEEKTYFPNFDFWDTQVNQGAPNRPKSSGITQPAVHGFILELLLEKYPDHPGLMAFAKQLFPKIVHYHRFLYTYRDPFKEGLFFIFHPWESGRDNSPLWDPSLDRIDISPKDLPSYTRRDTAIADPSERPTTAQYDRYVYLLLLGKRHQYDGAGIASESPFLVQDDMMNAILIKSNQSLINMGKRFGFDVAEIEEWQSQSIKQFHQKFWNERLQLFCPYDLRGQHQIEEKEIGGLIALFAHLPSNEQAQAINDYLVDLHERHYYLCPSFDVDSPYFDSKRYWRGPVWPHMNWMIYHGLKQYGFTQTAQQVRTDTLEIVEKFGFFEYFEPQKQVAKQTPRGYGGPDFSWTASSIIDLIHHP